MKRPFLLSSAMLLAATAAFSMPQPLPQAPTASPTAGQMPTPEQVVQKMGEKLSLTDQQKTQLTPIIADRQQKLQALRADTSMERPEKAQKARQIFQDSDTKIKAVLTDEQKQKYEAMQQQMRDEMRQRAREQQAPQ
jgi:Spy/CpxP family protein refolding chaperone